MDHASAFPSITPAGGLPSAAAPDRACCLGVFRDCLHLATLRHEPGEATGRTHIAIHRHDPASATWIPVFADCRDTPPPESPPPASDAPRPAACRAEIDQTGARPLVHLTWPGGELWLRPTADHASFAPADAPAPRDDAGLPRPASRLAVHGNRRYAAIDDAERGFEIWRADAGDGAPVWRRVLDRGASRFAQNRAVFALLPHGDTLLLAAGTAPEDRQPTSRFFDYRGFEILRLLPDDRWELLVGVPRFSPAGLQVPLSGRGAGLGLVPPPELLAAHCHAGRALLALTDDDGLHLWHSATGDDWAPLTGVDFSDIYRTLHCRMLSAGDLLVLQLEILTLDGQRETRIRAGRPRI